MDMDARIVVADAGSSHIVIVAARCFHKQEAERIYLNSLRRRERLYSQSGNVFMRGTGTGVYTLIARIPS